MGARVLAAVAAVVAMTFTAACGGEEGAASNGGSDGDPSETQQPSESSPATKKLPNNGAPKVADPIDTKPWESKPCDVISNDQLKSAGFPSTSKAFTAEDTSDGTGRFCTARWEGKHLRFTVGFYTGVKEGLSHFYARNKAGEEEYFEPEPDVSGHPGVALGLQKGDNTRCYFAAGITDERLLTIQYTAFTGADPKYSKDPCGTAATVAGLAIDTMKKGS